MRTPVQQGPLGRAVCRGASVGLEDRATEQPESACVGMDSLGLCKYTTINKAEFIYMEKNIFFYSPKVIIVFWNNFTL